MLNIKKIELPEPETNESGEPAKKITKLAIGVEGGVHFPLRANSSELVILFQALRWMRVRNSSW